MAILEPVSTKQSLPISQPVEIINLFSEEEDDEIAIRPVRKAQHRHQGR